MDRMVDHLTAEQRLLETLLCRLVAAHHLVVADEHRFLAQAADDIDRAVGAVRQAELLRAATLDEVLVDDGEGRTPPALDAMAARAQEPFRSILLAQRVTLASLLSEIEDAAALARELLDEGPPEPEGAA